MAKILKQDRAKKVTYVTCTNCEYHDHNGCVDEFDARDVRVICLCECNYE